MIVTPHFVFGGDVGDNGDNVSGAVDIIFGLFYWLSLILVIISRIWFAKWRELIYALLSEVVDFIAIRLNGNAKISY